jgi:hypothetical protein
LFSGLIAVIALLPDKDLVPMERTNENLPKDNVGRLVRLYGYDTDTFASRLGGPADRSTCHGANDRPGCRAVG